MGCSVKVIKPLNFLWNGGRIPRFGGKTMGINRFLDTNIPTLPLPCIDVRFNRWCDHLFVRTCFQSDVISGRSHISCFIMSMCLAINRWRYSLLLWFTTDKISNQTVPKKYVQKLYHYQWLLCMNAGSSYLFFKEFNHPSITDVYIWYFVMLKLCLYSKHDLANVL